MLLNMIKITLNQDNFNEFEMDHEPNFGILPTTYKALPKLTYF